MASLASRLSGRVCAGSRIWLSCGSYCTLNPRQAHHYLWVTMSIGGGGARGMKGLLLESKGAVDEARRQGLVELSVEVKRGFGARYEWAGTRHSPYIRRG